MTICDGRSNAPATLRSDSKSKSKRNKTITDKNSLRIQFLLDSDWKKEFPTFWLFVHTFCDSINSVAAAAAVVCKCGYTGYTAVADDATLPTLLTTLPMLASALCVCGQQQFARLLGNQCSHRRRRQRRRTLPLSLPTATASYCV